MEDRTSSIPAAPDNPFEAQLDDAGGSGAVQVDFGNANGAAAPLTAPVERKDSRRMVVDEAALPPLDTRGSASAGQAATELESAISQPLSARIEHEPEKRGTLTPPPPTVG